MSGRQWAKDVSLCFEHVRAVSRTQPPLVLALAFVSLLPVPMTSLYKQAYSAFLNEKPRVRYILVYDSTKYPISSFPQSSTTEWVEILTSSSYEAEAYDG